MTTEQKIIRAKVGLGVGGPRSAPAASIAIRFVPPKVILAPPSSRDIWIHPLSIIEGANPAHVAHAHIAHARARHRRARGSAIIRLDDKAPDPGQTIPAEGISLLSIIHNRAFRGGSVCLNSFLGLISGAP